MFVVPADWKSWMEVAPGSDFPIQNIPFGIIKVKGERPAAATIVGDTVIDLHELEVQGHFTDMLGQDRHHFLCSSLNAFMALGRVTTGKVRERLATLFRDTASEHVRDQVREASYAVSQVELLMPIEVGDYTDFYSSRDHAYNVGVMFRGPENALMPNWLHLPVGYHGRASSIVVSGTPVRRPSGQYLPQGAEVPSFGASQRMDFELEVAAVVGRGNEMGTRITTTDAAQHLFGLLLFNDWSARDLQQWEYVPLGPFLGKNFASTVSPWVVTLDALEPFRIPGPEQSPKVLPYLEYSEPGHYDIHLELGITTPEGVYTPISLSNFKYLYWNMAQQVAHHTIGGCNLRPGDLLASGTISGPDPGSRGSMLELAWKGTQPVPLNDGTTRTFLKDGDTVIIKGWSEKDGVRIGFGECRGTLLPALEG